MSQNVTLQELARHLKGKLILAPEQSLDDVIVGISVIEDAVQGQLSFVSNQKYVKFVGSTKASALIVDTLYEQANCAQIVCANPYAQYARAATLFAPATQHPQGIAPQAVVSDEAKVADSAVIYPYAYIERGAVIGDHVVVYPYVHIGENAVVGEHSVLQPHVTLYHGVQLGKRVTVHAGAVIGSDGFGYANDGEEVLKIPQLGTVVIEDDVEIGSLANIDRGTIAATRIGEKTKIDSKVHIGHNVQIGKGCMLAAFTGIAGSSHVGDRVLTGGHSGIVGHVKVASGTILSAMSLISNDISKGEYLSGFPAIPSMKWKRSRIAEKKLPATNRQVQELSRKVIELEDKLASFLKKT